MARWEPDAGGRLASAAMALFAARGYDRTTVEDIAAAAGLTERTFFRYFADKREVLFAGTAALEAAITDAIAAAPATLAPLPVVARAFEAAAETLQAHRDFTWVRARHALIVRHAELHERELTKMAALAVLATRALHARGVDEPAATLAAEMGVAAFKVGFERWVSGKPPRGFAAHVRDAVDGIVAVAGPGARSKARAPKPRARRQRDVTGG